MSKNRLFYTILRVMCLDTAGVYGNYRREGRSMARIRERQDSWGNREEAEELTAVRQKESLDNNEVLR